MDHQIDDERTALARGIFYATLLVTPFWIAVIAAIRAL